MHAPPCFQMTVSRFEVWRLSCAALVLLAGSVWMVWALAAAQAMFATTVVVGVIWAGCAIAVASMLLRLSPTQIRWDTQSWHVSDVEAHGGSMHGEPTAGHLEVMWDGGAWMLLRFSSTGRPRFQKWLPVQRHGHEIAWHSLRWTLYGARPAEELSPAQI